MEASTETAVRREISIAARPETVWEFLVQPEKATRWMGQAASLDPRPGGEYRVEVLSGNVAVGEFVEVDPPHRLVWTWGWTDESQSPVPPGSTRIEVELEPDGDGTLLRFIASGLPDAAAPRDRGARRRPRAGYLARRDDLARCIESSAVHFEKWQALGNDYVIVEERELPFELTPARVRAICAPHTGVGPGGIPLTRGAAN